MAQPTSPSSRTSRRDFLKTAAVASAAPALFHIVPRHCLGGPGVIPPSETVGAALIGCGGRGPGTFSEVEKSFKAEGNAVKQLAMCDVKFGDRADGKFYYTDF